MAFLQSEKFPEFFMDEHKHSITSKGYNVIPDFLKNDEVDFLKDRLERAIAEYVPFDDSPRSLLDRYHMHDLLCKDICFGKTLEDERIQQLIEPFLGKYWIMYAYTSSSLPPYGSNYGGRIHVDCPRFIPYYPTNLGVIWALDDFTLENGATYLLPGSHNSEQVPSENYFRSNSVRLTCTKGSLIVFNARLWHAAGVNNTAMFRHALTMNVCRPYMKQRIDWVRFIPEAISSQLNKQARRILGFDTRVPANLQEFFLPEDQRLYKANQE